MCAVWRGLPRQAAVLLHYLFFIKFIYFERQSEKGKTERESFIYWSTPQIPTADGTGLGQSQEPETPPGSLMWVTGTQTSTWVCLSRRLDQKCKQDRIPGTVTGDGANLGSCLPFYATMPTCLPRFCLLNNTFIGMWFSICSSEWFLMYPELSNHHGRPFRTFSSPQAETLHPLAVTPHLLPLPLTPQSSVTTNYSLTLDSPVWDTSYQSNNVLSFVSGLFHLV